MDARWTTAKEARKARQRQLEAPGDAQFVLEVREHQFARWRPPKLIEHVKKHQTLYAECVGHVVGQRDIEEITEVALHSWDRLFSSVEADGRISYTFLVSWTEGQALLTITRAGTIRTLIPTRNLTGYLGRHPALVEVTDRARKLGI